MKKLYLSPALIAFAVIGCAEENSLEPSAAEPTQSVTSSAADTSGENLPDAVATPDVAEEPDNDDDPASSANSPNASDAPGPYIAQLTKPVAVVNIANPGTLSVRNGCLVVTLEGKTYTAVFNGNASLGSSGVRYEGGMLALDQTVPIPGGRLDRSEISLKSPAAAGCPGAFFGIGG